MSWIVLPFVVVALGSILFLVVKLRETEGFWIAWKPGTSLRKRDCTTCGGCGVLWWNGRRWKILPRSLRTYNHGQGRHFQVNQANVRKCPECLGAQFRWVGREASN